MGTTSELYINELKQALNHNHASVLIGSGFSLNADDVNPLEPHRKKIPHEIVEELYKHVIDNPESAVVREAFFNMLKQSEDAGRNSDYFSPEIIKGALQDARYNSLMGRGVDELDLYESLIEAAVVSEQDVDRGAYKIGRNDPCPCGSGKKYKKCCFGKGIYD